MLSTTRIDEVEERQLDDITATQQVRVTTQQVRDRHVYVVSAASSLIYVKKLISLKHCVRSQITRLKLQKSFCDLEHGASL